MSAEHPPPTDPGHHGEPAPPPGPPAPPSAPPSVRRRIGPVAAAVAAGVLLLAGAGVAVAVVLSGGDDERDGDRADPDPTSSQDTTASPDETEPTLGVGETDLEGLLLAAGQAAGVVPGAIVAIEELAPGTTWRVNIEFNVPPTSTEVTVDGSGARVTGEEAVDDPDTLFLTPETVTAVVEAVSEETPGRVVKIESDDDRYLVTLLEGSGSKVELVVDTEFRVTDSDSDDD